ncbi:GntR family transcriptional regulator [Rouxiella badensis]|uniref:FadR/GntR family transcriptional regulator n=1 Tax=Rouxiella badensis TaxID=1646377 RepID=UPI001D141A72|nr:GntR family transcriptional regulator [Rouxiella badensis]MCC3718510.1 GntR family transcriptional regulator [Rouxiella badensis]MCC3726722.1 GntR family transcriptional regulator [Rouxiella badensis]
MTSDLSIKETRPVTDPARRKRTDQIADEIKKTIINDNLVPGDRLPQEKDLTTRFAAGKGTVREALKSLEVQGLIRTRTGPGGGAFIESMSETRAMSLLSNYLFTRQLSISDIYSLRKALEPVVAVSAIENMDEAGFDQLQQLISVYDRDPANDQERWDQLMAELDFHGVVASYSDNVLLAFICHFLQRLLKDLAVCKKIYKRQEPIERSEGIALQTRLIDAMRRRDAQQVMREHMHHAEKTMVALRATLDTAFL